MFTSEITSYVEHYCPTCDAPRDSIVYKGATAMSCLFLNMKSKKSRPQLELLDRVIGMLRDNGCMFNGGHRNAQKSKSQL